MLSRTKYVPTVVCTAISKTQEHLTETVQKEVTETKNLVDKSLEHLEEQVKNLHKSVLRYSTENEFPMSLGEELLILLVHLAHSSTSNKDTESYLGMLKHFAGWWNETSTQPSDKRTYVLQVFSENKPPDDTVQKLLVKFR